MTMGVGIGAADEASKVQFSAYALQLHPQPVALPLHETFVTFDQSQCAIPRLFRSRPHVPVTVSDLGSGLWHSFSLQPMLCHPFTPAIVPFSEEPISDMHKSQPLLPP